MLKERGIENKNNNIKVDKKSKEGKREKVRGKGDRHFFETANECIFRGGAARATRALSTRKS